MKELIIYWAVVSVLLFVSTFVCYVAIMKMREIKSEIYALHWTVRWVCFGILFVGLILDTLLNWGLLSVAFLEIPHEVLSTTRVVRHKRANNGWRTTQANWWCKNFLTPFDKSHCE